MASCKLEQLRPRFFDSRSLNPSSFECLDCGRVYAPGAQMVECTPSNRIVHPTTAPRMTMNARVHEIVQCPRCKHGVNHPYSVDGSEPCELCGGERRLSTRRCKCGRLCRVSKMHCQGDYCPETPAVATPTAVVAKDLSIVPWHQGDTRRMQ
jgi:hypothetical protein